ENNSTVQLVHPQVFIIHPFDVGHLVLRLEIEENPFFNDFRKFLNAIYPGYFIPLFLRNADGLSNFRDDLQVRIEFIGKGKAEILQSGKAGEDNEKGKGPGKYTDSCNDGDNIDGIAAALGKEVASGDVEGEIHLLRLFPSGEQIWLIYGVVLTFQGSVDVLDRK